MPLQFIIENISTKKQIFPEQIKPDSKFRNDLKMDSLDMVELEFDLEREFKIVIDLIGKEVPETIQDLVNTISEKLV